MPWNRAICRRSTRFAGEPHRTLVLGAEHSLAVLYLQGQSGVLKVGVGHEVASW